VNVLVAVAHPDDEALGCGGTIAKMSEAGHRVVVLLPVHRCDDRGKKHWPDLVKGIERSCVILGATLEMPSTTLPETEAETHPHLLHDLILPFVERAEQVLTHWPGDANQVHRGIARAVEVATRPFRRRRNVSLFEVLTSTGQGFASVSPPFAPTEYIVLEDRHARKKCEAMACYETEAVAGRAPDDVERQLRSRGAEIGARFAEAFVVARRFG
jgi:LmbE family N-acetylglucosaminyl deacetylase